MVNYCCANNCSSEYIPGSDVKFHSFLLNNPEKLNKWTNAVKREHFKPNKSTVICSKHFHSTDYYDTTLGKKYLKKDAIPSIFDYSDHLKKKDSSRRIIIQSTPATSSEVNTNMHIDFGTSLTNDSNSTALSPKTASTQTTLTGTELVKTWKEFRRQKKIMLQRIKRRHKTICNLQGLVKTLKTNRLANNTSLQSAVEGKIIAHTTTASCKSQEERMVTEGVRSSSTVVDNNQSLSRHSRNSSVSSADSGTPIDVDDTAAPETSLGFYNGSFQHTTKGLNQSTSKNCLRSYCNMTVEKVEIQQQA